MSSHVYHEIYLHLNWHIKYDAPVLTGSTEELVHGLLREKCRLLKGVYLHGINGTDTHVHLALNIEPSVTIARMLQELKGLSAFEANQRLGRKLVEWQRGYGVVSFGLGNLAWVQNYVNRQREHHASGHIEERLEACDTPDEPESPAEAG